MTSRFHVGSVFTAAVRGDAQGGIHERRVEPAVCGADPRQVRRQLIVPGRHPGLYGRKAEESAAALLSTDSQPRLALEDGIVSRKAFTKCILIHLGGIKPSSPYSFESPLRELDPDFVSGAARREPPV